MSTSFGQQIGSGLSGLGTIIGAAGQLNAGNASMQAAQYSAAQMRQNASQTIAAGTANVQGQMLQTQMLQSRALAVGAASGAGALDPTVVNLVSQIAGYGAYNAGMATYNAQSRAAAQQNEANATVFSGQQAQTASRWKAGSTILTGASTFMNGL